MTLSANDHFIYKRDSSVPLEICTLNWFWVLCISFHTHCILHANHSVQYLIHYWFPGAPCSGSRIYSSGKRAMQKLWFAQRIKYNSWIGKQLQLISIAHQALENSPNAFKWPHFPGIQPAMVDKKKIENCWNIIYKELCRILLGYIHL